ncbi:MAG: M48 family metalloprotease [Armatimonadota bacterium]
MLADQIKKESLSKDKALQERVNRIGQSLVKQLDNVMYPYEFNVVADPEINAFALPGGFLFFNEGLLNKFPDDDALSYVIGHELTHSAHRHTANTFKKTDLISFLGTLASLAIDDDKGILAGAVTVVSYLSYSREHERDADWTGIRLAWLAGYDPKGSSEVLKEFIKLEGDDGGPKFLRTHPPSKDRLKHAEEEYAELAKESRPSRPVEALPVVDLASVAGDLKDLLPKPNSYFPLAPGNEWTYSVSGLGGETSYTVRVLGAIPAAGGDVYRVETFLGGKDILCQMLTTESDVWRRSRPTVPASPWRLDCLLDADSDPVSIGDETYTVLRLEEVSVPCGDFSGVLHVRKSGGVTVDMWYAPKVGLLKRSCTETGVTETLIGYRVEP